MNRNLTETFGVLGLDGRGRAASGLVRSSPCSWSPREWAGFVERLDAFAAGFA